MTEVQMMTYEGSNSLADLAARIRQEHAATAEALQRGVEHAMAAGDLLLEAKAQLKHGLWLPWLAEHCQMSERTAQLYMRVAKNRATIEAKAQRVADLTLNQAAALLVLTSDIDKLFAFAKQVEGVTDSDELVSLCIANDIGVIQDSSYHPLAGRSEIEGRDWHIFMLFLTKWANMSPKGASQHVEWLLQRPFQNVGEWLGEEGAKFRKCWRMGEPSSECLKAWPVFRAEHADKTLQELVLALETLQESIEQASARPPVRRKAKGGKPTEPALSLSRAIDRLAFRTIDRV
jgi:hypothetical protein